MSVVVVGVAFVVVVVVVVVFINEFKRRDHSSVMSSMNSSTPYNCAM